MLHLYSYSRGISHDYLVVLAYKGYNIGPTFMLTALLRYVLLCDGSVVERRRAWVLADYMPPLFRILCSVMYYSNSIGTSYSELPCCVYSIAE
jgi:hypothetical protein